MDVCMCTTESLCWKAELITTWYVSSTSVKAGTLVLRAGVALGKSQALHFGTESWCLHWVNPRLYTLSCILQLCSLWWERARLAAAHLPTSLGRFQMVRRRPPLLCKRIL